GLAEPVDQGGADVVVAEPEPRLVQRPGGVHLDVALADRRPGAERVQCPDEGERGSGQVVQAAGDGEPDVGAGQPGAGEGRGDRAVHQAGLAVRGALGVDPGGVGDDGDGAHRRSPSAPVPRSGTNQRMLGRVRVRSCGGSHSARTRMPACTFPGSTPLIRASRSTSAPSSRTYPVTKGTSGARGSGTWLTEKVVSTPVPGSSTSPAIGEPSTGSTSRSGT